MYNLAISCSDIDLTIRTFRQVFFEIAPNDTDHSCGTVSPLWTLCGVILLSHSAESVQLAGVTGGKNIKWYMKQL